MSPRISNETMEDTLGEFDFADLHDDATALAAAVHDAAHADNGTFFDGCLSGAIERARDLLATLKDIQQTARLLQAEKDEAEEADALEAAQAEFIAAVSQ